MLLKVPSTHVVDAVIVFTVGVLVIARVDTPAFVALVPAPAVVVVVTRALNAAVLHVVARR